MLDQALAALVTLDGRHHKRLRPEIRFPQPDLAGPGLQRALVMPGPVTRRVLRCALLVVLRIASASQCLLHATANRPVEMLLGLIIINRDEIRSGNPASFMTPRDAGLRSATASSVRILDRQPIRLFIFEKRIILNARIWFEIQEDWRSLEWQRAD